MRNKKFFLYVSIMIIAVSASLPLFSSGALEKITTWDHKDQEFYTLLTGTLIDNDGHFVAKFSRKGMFLITPDKVTLFAPDGQGPSDISIFMCLCNYQKGISFFEYGLKVKIFEKRDNQYHLKDIIRFQQKRYPLIARRVIYFDSKWFFAGRTQIVDEPTYKKDSLMTVYDNQGKILAQLIEREYKEWNAHNNLDHFVEQGQGRVFFMIANDPTVIEIDPKELKIKATFPLEVPPFYKKMPVDFYIFKRYDQVDGNPLSRDIEYWKTHYSSITNIATVDNLLILQMRTCSETLKPYALLIYDIATMKLLDTIYTNDYFLGAGKGQYYFYRNGLPGLDDDTDNCIIDIYRYKR